MSQTATDFLREPPPAIRGRLRTVEFPSGAIILEQGAHPDYVYILTSGEARVYSLTPNGSRYLEHIYAAGELFGEFEALNERPYLCSIQASGPCQAVRIEDADFLAWMKADSDFALFISRQMADKLYRSSLDAVVNIVYPLRYRVLYFLWNVAQNGAQEVRKEDLIAGLGSNERSVNRILRDLINGLLIDSDRGMISIPDLDELVREMKRYE